MKKLIRLLALTSLFNVYATETDLKAYVESELPKVSDVKKIQWGNKSYWIKKADPNKGYISCLGKKISTYLVPDRIIAPTPICNNDLLATEARRLSECEKKQGNCTKLILTGKNWILVNDAGLNFEKFIKEQQPNQRLSFILQGLDAIFRLHHKGLVQGRASAKDITIDSNNHLTFIDFAEAPESFMDFDEARTRDLINYFMTTLPLLDKPELKQHYANLFIEKFPKDLMPLLSRVIDNTNFLGKIAGLIKGFAGNDVRKFALAHQLLKEKLNPIGSANKN